MAATPTMPVGFDPLLRAWMVAEQVWDRCRRFAKAMEAEDVPYAIIGGNAVATWVTTVNPSAVRNTADVDVLLRRADIERAAAAAAKAGFEHVQIGESLMHVFRDNPAGKSPRQAMIDSVHVIFAAEKVNPKDPVETPDVTDFQFLGSYRTVSLEGLVRMKLVAHRLKDQVHLQDMVREGLIDASWPARFPPPLDGRLAVIIANPDA